MITDRELQIASTKIGPGHSTYFIADIAANHDGDLSKAKDLIYLAAEAGADAAKFAIFKRKPLLAIRDFVTWGQSNPINRPGKSRSVRSTKMQC